MCASFNLVVIEGAGFTRRVTAWYGEAWFGKAWRGEDANGVAARGEGFLPLWSYGQQGRKRRVACFQSRALRPPSALRNTANRRIKSVSNYRGGNSRLCDIRQSLNYC